MSLGRFSFNKGIECKCWVFKVTIICRKSANFSINQSEKQFEWHQLLLLSNANMEKGGVAKAHWQFSNSSNCLAALIAYSKNKHYGINRNTASGNAEHQNRSWVMNTLNNKAVQCDYFIHPEQEPFQATISKGPKLAKIKTGVRTATSYFFKPFQILNPFWTVSTTLIG